MAHQYNSKRKASSEKQNAVISQNKMENKNYNNKLLKMNEINRRRVYLFP